MQIIKIITVRFYQSDSGKEPVKEWLKSLSREDMKIIGEDIKTVEFGWPLGMPLVRKMDRDLWEVRVDLTNREIARVFFTVKNGFMVLLHGFKKKSQQTPLNELNIYPRYFKMLVLYYRFLRLYIEKKFTIGLLLLTFFQCTDTKIKSYKN